MLLAPSWGGMINGLLTLRGVWDKVRVDPVLKFFVSYYGLRNGNFEGPMLSLENVNAMRIIQIGLLLTFTCIGLERIYGFWYDLLVGS
jgi:cbb3-type cytochrome oxidase subunit 1